MASERGSNVWELAKGTNSVGCSSQPMWALFSKPGKSLGNTSMLPEPTWACEREMEEVEGEKLRR